jgi:hypothetical protein
MCERLLRRAYSLQGGWKEIQEIGVHSWFDAFNPPHSMSLLPGGRYLVVSSIEVTTEKPTLTVWDLEFPQPAHDRSVPLKRRAAIARVVIPGPVMEMRTKYMCVGGVNGIVIALILNTAKQYKYAFTRVCVLLFLTH